MWHQIYNLEKINSHFMRISEVKMAIFGFLLSKLRFSYNCLLIYHAGSKIITIEIVKSFSSESSREDKKFIGEVFGTTL